MKEFLSGSAKTEQATEAWWSFQTSVFINHFKNYFSFIYCEDLSELLFFEKDSF